MLLSVERRKGEFHLLQGHLLPPLAALVLAFSHPRFIVLCSDKCRKERIGILKLDDEPSMIELPQMFRRFEYLIPSFNQNGVLCVASSQNRWCCKRFHTSSSTTPSRKRRREELNDITPLPLQNVHLSTLLYNNTKKKLYYLSLDRQDIYEFSCSDLKVVSLIGGDGRKVLLATVENLLFYARRTSSNIWELCQFDVHTLQLVVFGTEHYINEWPTIPHACILDRSLFLFTLAHKSSAFELREYEIDNQKWRVQPVFTVKQCDWDACLTVCSMEQDLLIMESWKETTVWQVDPRTLYSRVLHTEKSHFIWNKIVHLEVL